MSDKKEKKLSYAMTEVNARRQLESAKDYGIKAKSLLETYFCSDHDIRYRDQAIETLAEYLTNTKFYAEFIENQLQSDNRMKNKKTGEEQIVVNTSDFNILNGYLVVMAACENELETLGISMRSH
jgi:hypothetical protein